MAPKGRASTRKRSSRKLRYFFLDASLHRVLSVNRAQDLMVAWKYDEGKRVAYVWSDVRNRMEQAFSLSEVAKMIGRHRVHLEGFILQGKIRTPQRIYTLSADRKPGKYFFSEKDVYELHDYLLTVHIGRPRKDGQVTPGRGLPSRAELRSMIQHDIVTYVKTADGEFIPTWKEHNW